MFSSIPDQKAHNFDHSVYEVFRSITSLCRYLPAALKDWLLIGVRLFFFALLGFAAWVRSFSNTALSTWICIALVLSFLVHAYFSRICLFPEEKCAGKEDNNVRDWVKSELMSQKTVCDTLERVQAALESKTRIELEAENATERWKKQLQLSEQVAFGLRRQLSELNKAKTQLERELHKKIHENKTINSDFEKNLGYLNETVQSVKSIEFSKNRLENLLSSEKDALKMLKDENEMLKATVEIMTKQRKTLTAKHDSAMKEVRHLSSKKESLEKQLEATGREKNGEARKVEDLKKLTQRLQTSISSAKGKLSKVEDVLGSESERSTATTPRRALSPQPKNLHIFRR